MFVKANIKLQPSGRPISNIIYSSKMKKKNHGLYLNEILPH